MTAELVKETEAFVEARTKTGEVKARAEAMTVETNADIAEANEVMAQAKKYTKIVKAEKEKITKPAKEIIAAAKDMYDETEKDLKAIADIMKTKILTARAKLQREADEKAAKIEARVAPGKGHLTVGSALKQMSDLDVPDDQIIGNAGSTSFSKRKVAVIVDYAKIPAEYFQREGVMRALQTEINRDALGNKAQGIEPIEIPGVEIQEVDSLSTSV